MKQMEQRKAGKAPEACGPGLGERLASARETDECIRQGIFWGETLQNLDFCNLEWSQVSFEKCRFESCIFSGASFYSVLFQSCSFSNCRVSNTYWQDSQLCSSKADGIDFRKSRWKHCIICQTLLRYTNFSESVWNGISLRDCNICDAALSAMRIMKAELHQVNFTGSDFFRTQLKGVDLSDCVIEGISVSESLQELKGATIDVTQASVLAGLLGVHVV